MKFDYIISNPPYNIGNTITRFVVDNVNFDNFINLMPLSCYKSKELYKTVKSLEVVDPSAFEDAAITDNLCICELGKDEIENQTYEDLALKTYKEEFKEFYKLNAKCKETFIKGPYDSIMSKSLEEYKHNLHFYVPKRTCDNGVHKSVDTADIRWNILKDYSDDITKLIVKYSPTFKHDYLSGSFFIFNSDIEKENFNIFWYKNPLMNNLIRGLNKRSGPCREAIPNIDYSIDRDYEHLTLDDIMKILREEIDC